MSTDQLDEFVRNGIEEARRFGISVVRDIYVFMNIKAVAKIHGSCCRRRHNWVYETLHGNPGSPVRARLEQLCNIVQRQRRA